MSELSFYNTLGRELQAFESLEEGRVGLYTCGPTVYASPHIGNLRTFVFEDVLRRALELFGYEVNQVMNLTDVEDKIIAGALEAGVDIETYTAPFIEQFFVDLERLSVKPACAYPRATEHIPGMLEMIQELVDRGHAYEVDGSVYFHVDSAPTYGALSGIDLCNMRRGSRVQDDEYAKDDIRDFVLWKACKSGEPSWESPWGPGRPGWHIECSAMSRDLLGESFDIHCGGVDNIFPHHENEIAQSEAATGKPFVRYWLHSEHLTVDGEKMSKSLGNQYTLDDLTERGVSLRAVRYLFVSVHYRQRLNFTMESVEKAGAALRRLDEMCFHLSRAKRTKDATEGPGLVDAAQAALSTFKRELANDLNVSGALGAVFGLVREVNRALPHGITDAEYEEIRSTLDAADSVLGVLDAECWSALDGASDSGLSDEEVEERLAQRREARDRRDFAEADRLRDELTAAGIVVEDGPDGTVWRRG